MVHDLEREPPDRTSVDFAAVAKVASVATIQHVRLLEARVERERAPEALPPDWGQSAYVGFRAGSTRVHEESWFTVATGFLCVFKEGWNPDEGGMPEFSDDDPPDVYLEAAFELVYALTDGVVVDAQDLEHFAYANGTHNAWPYWRELAQGATLRMGIPPLVVGPFKVPSKFDPR